MAGIYIAPEAAGPILSLPEVEVIAGRGLKGDRYFAGEGTYSNTPGTGRQVTLIEQEALAAAGRDYGIELEPGQSRRNIETVGVPLNHLVGKEFMVGEVDSSGCA